MNKIKLGTPYWDGSGFKKLVTVFDFKLPENHTFTAPPEVKSGTVKLIAGEWVNYRKLTAYLKADCTKSRVFADVSLVTSDYTMIPPVTIFDEWLGEQWVTNNIEKYNADERAVINARRMLYSAESDPLINEAIIKEALGEPEQAQELKARAIEVRARIQANNPFPEPVQG